LSLETAVNVLAGVLTFSSNEVFLVFLESVWVSEGDLSEGSTSTRFVDDVSDATADVSVIS